MPQGPRERLLASAIALMRERGVHATGLADLLEHSKTARGSLYQHFPRGKTELMEQATLLAGHTIGRRIERALAQGDPASAVGTLIDYWITSLASSDYTHGCPVLAAAQSGPAEPAVQAAAATALKQWSSLLATALAEHGMPNDSAGPLGSTIIATIEGAIARSFAARSTTPLTDARTVLVPLVEQAMKTRAPATAT
ncbi:TetR/AcrR family transcriptional regulator [Hoyosella sp. G463]|uniref:TetR/AcrR family transcriptional regulator n=1 Tax=Lolliginicoccus lacisalsi TaxID=2742202 RepID=A0A927PKX1_9ACTN|nr:TetR/AcrR family transcriptional regulator [Lolliginicoccus lacisalsi]MBD8506163.1 TetR/AcrR family transcriptional regulator [Lolliginicoccus lacisalsi]